MIKRIYVICAFVLSFSSFVGCDSDTSGNPLVGRWQQISPPGQPPGQIIEFTPSTMRFNNQVVTVVYQVRENKVRVSASKPAIIYVFDDADSIHYDDDKHGTVRLIRVKP